MSTNEFSPAFSTAFDPSGGSAPDACSWPVSFSECGTCEPLSSMPASGQAVYVEMATTYLWNWTGRKFGACPVTIRPCRQDCTEGISTFNGRHSTLSGWAVGSTSPALIRGQWFNIGCGVCGDRCGCGWSPALRLPGPVASVGEILIDGAVLPASAYRVDNGRLLVRTDGGRWPTCQNMNAPTTEPGTWQITYDLGLPVPAGGQVAAGVLACELAKAACHDKTCLLPTRVQTITRQGITVAVLDSFDDIDSGHTGIWLIDSWVASVTKPRQPSRVYSPDLPLTGTARRTTWSG